MRVNIEDDLWTSGRLSKLARSAKLDEDTALGRLVNVYRLTQRAGIAIESAARICTVVVLAFESDEAADQFLTAMISAQLAAVLEDGRIHIRGNDKHVARVAEMLANASKGGKKSQQKKRNDFESERSTVGSTVRSTDTQASGERIGTLPAPSSQLPDLASQVCDSRSSGAHTENNRPEQPRPLLVDQQQIPPIAVAKAWDAYRKAREAKKKPAPLQASEIDKIHLRRVIGWTSPEEAPGILEAWTTIDNANKTLSANGWPLAWLTQDDNLERARNKAEENRAAAEKKQKNAATAAQINASTDL